MLRPTKTVSAFFKYKRRAHHLPYYLQGLSDRLENTQLSTTRKIESHPPPKGFKFSQKKRGHYFKVNNKSYKTNNDIVKLDFQDEKSDNEDTEFNERNKKRTYSIDNKESVMVTPKKKCTGYDKI